MGADLNEWLKENIGFDDRWVIDRVEFSTKPLSIDVFVSYSGPRACPVCGRACKGYDRRARKWRDLDFGSSVCNITASVPRLDCPDHGIHEVDVPWSGRVSRLTHRFERECAEYSRYMPVHLVGRMFRVRDHTIWALIRHYTDVAMTRLDLSGLTVVCIDETSSKKGHNYITTFTDPRTGGIVFATLDRDTGTIRRFSRWLVEHGGVPAQIRAVCCDMSASFTKGVRDEFPGAAIIYDPFHVIQAANDTLEAVRRTSGLKGTLGKGLRFDFLRNRESLDGDRRARLEAVFEDYFYIGRAYVIKELLRDFYRVADYDTAVEFLLGIIDRCLDSANRDIFDLGITLDHHFRGILEWHRRHVSNGVAEGNNSVIQAMKRSARGYREPENMIALIYLRNLPKNGLDL